MSDPLSVTPTCYSWHQFSISGDWIEGGGIFGRGEYRMRQDIFHWLVENIKGQWARIDGGERCPLFIREGRDVMLFKLTWVGN